MIKLTLVSLLAAAAAYFSCHHACDEIARRAVIKRRNHRGLEIAAAGGVSLVVGFLAAALVVILALVPLNKGSFGFVREPMDAIALSMVPQIAVIAAMFALFGLYEDVAGNQGGPLLGALRHKQATPAVLMVVGGILVAMLTVPPVDLWDLLLAAAIVSLGAQILVGFAQAPLRTTKAAGIWAAVLLLAALIQASVASVPGLIVVAASAAGIWKSEALERIEHGISGATALGGALGLLTASVANATSTRLIVVAVLAGIVILQNKSSEDLFEKVGPLRKLDRLGRRWTRPTRSESASPEYDR
jgi:hypothetical protein